MIFEHAMWVRHVLSVSIKYLIHILFVPRYAASVVWSALASCQYGPSARVALLGERLRLMVHQ